MQARKPSEVLSFAQCTLKLPVTNELLIPTHPFGEQIEELQNVMEFGDKNLENAIHPLTEAILGQGGDIPPGGEIPPFFHKSQHGG